MNEKNTHCCPWWMGYFLLNPLRRLGQNPRTLLAPFLKKGMKVVDYGPGMGFFSLEMARLVGPEGTVHAVDIQKKMLDALQRRARRRGLAAQIESLLLAPGGDWTVGLQEQIDFVLAAAVVHEVADQAALFKDFMHVIKPGGVLFFAEPKGHVSAEKFAASLKLAGECGFTLRAGDTAKREAVLIK